jgi:N-formylglutamate deformylase
VLAQGDYSSVCNGRFKGGYITRQYGSPEHHIHAVQLELSQITYMPDQNSFEYSEQRAAQVKPLIKKLVQQMISHPFTRD